MAERLRDAVSPYLRAHADNPVDWWPWGEEAFAEARRRDVPVMVSIGYATCHWCHVMARESFSDARIAAKLDAGFVAVKVDREEHPQVDAAFMAAASAFTQQLGWPLTVFTTPEGRAFFAGTYYPPQPVQGMPSFEQVLDAVTEAWTGHREQVEATGAAVVEAINAMPVTASALPDVPQLALAAMELQGYEDDEFGGFGRDAKFPNAPVIAFLAERARHGDPHAGPFARRLWEATQALRDPVEGGFFRYAVQRDWTEPHYERMLSDNAQLLDLATAFGDAEAAEAVAGFLTGVLRLAGGAFASAQDSESIIDGRRNEGGYYALDAEGRASLDPPALDAKVLTGLNGMAIGALADAGVRFGRADWIAAAREAAAAVVAVAVVDGPEGLVVRRAVRDGLVSDAAATLEDVGGLAGGLLRLAVAAGDGSLAALARRLVEACIENDGDDLRVRAPGGGDAVLAGHGIRVDVDQTEGATPSGAALFAVAAAQLAALTGEQRLLRAAETAIAPLIEPALARPIAFGATLAVADRLAATELQLVVVVPSPDAADELVARARAWAAPGRTLAVVTEEQAVALADAGLSLFAERTVRDGESTAYLCEGVVCRLPTTDAALLGHALGD